MTEPTYEYVKGQGWIATQTDIDIRTDKSKPGVFRLQVWLVGIPGYDYKDWVDLRWKRLYHSENDLDEDIIYWLNNNYLIERGAKYRVLIVNDNGQWDLIPEK